MQYIDTALGEVIEAMERAGIYDDSLLIVVADHGIALRPNIEHWRQIAPDTVGEIAAVPLFVKAPDGEGAGLIDDRRALTIDIVPTIADVLGVDFPWTTEGSSLFAPEPERTETTTSGPQSDATYGVGGDEKLAVADATQTGFRPAIRMSYYLRGPRTWWAMTSRPSPASARTSRSESIGRKGLPTSTLPPTPFPPASPARWLASARARRSLSLWSSMVR